MKKIGVVIALLLSTLIAPIVQAPAAHAINGHRYVFNDQNSVWPIQATVDYYDGMININPGTWSYWAPVTVPVVNYVYNGYGSCLKFWITYNMGATWTYYGVGTAQGFWFRLSTGTTADFGVTAKYWGGVTNVC